MPYPLWSMCPNSAPPKELHFWTKLVIILMTSCPIFLQICLNGQNQRLSCQNQKKLRGNPPQNLTLLSDIITQLLILKELCIYSDLEIEKRALKKAYLVVGPAYSMACPVPARAQFRSGPILWQSPISALVVLDMIMQQKWHLLETSTETTNRIHKKNPYLLLF
jgi:hypothetical protein